MPTNLLGSWALRRFHDDIMVAHTIPVRCAIADTVPILSTHTVPIPLTKVHAHTVTILFLIFPALSHTIPNMVWIIHIAPITVQDNIEWIAMRKYVYKAIRDRDICMLFVNHLGIWHGKIAQY